MPRSIRIITTAIAIAALAAPTALAQPADIHAPLAKAASDSHKQHLRSPDTRDAAPATTPSDRNTARPDTAGSPNLTSAGVHHPAQAKSDDKHATTDDNVTAAEDRALAQERYYDVLRQEHATTDDNVTPAADSRAGPGALLRRPTASPRRRPSRRGPWRPTPATGSPHCRFVQRASSAP